MFLRSSDDSTAGHALLACTVLKNLSMCNNAAPVKRIGFLRFDNGVASFRDTRGESVISPTTPSAADVRIKIAFYRVAALSPEGSRPADILCSLLSTICSLPFTAIGDRSDRYFIRDHDRRDFVRQIDSTGANRFIYYRGLGANDALAESAGNIRAVTLRPGEAQAKQHFCLAIPDETLAVASLNQPVSARTIETYIRSKVPTHASALTIGRLVSKSTIERMENESSLAGFTIRLRPSRLDVLREQDALLYGAAKAKHDFCGLERVIVLPFKVQKADRGRMAQFIKDNVRRWRSNRVIDEAITGLTVDTVDPRSGRKMSVDVKSEHLTATASVRRMATDPSLAGIDEIYDAIRAAARALASEIDIAYQDASWTANQSSNVSMGIQNSLLDLLQEE